MKWLCKWIVLLCDYVDLKPPNLDTDNTIINFDSNPSNYPKQKKRETRFHAFSISGYFNQL